MLNLDTSVKSENLINQKVLEEKFAAGLMEFEALIHSVSDDRKLQLVDLLEQFTQK
ncbi:MAG: hypothetical protein P8H31_08645 [Porticoccaceae bacterium]|nr:hypothetical protein [Porticoccaceae bacterium]